MAILFNRMRDAADRSKDIRDLAIGCPDSADHGIG